MTSQVQVLKREIGLPQPYHPTAESFVYLSHTSAIWFPRCRTLGWRSWILEASLVACRGMRIRWGACHSAIIGRCQQTRRRPSSPPSQPRVEQGPLPRRPLSGRFVPGSSFLRFVLVSGAVGYYAADWCCDCKGKGDQIVTPASCLYPRFLFPTT